MKDMKETKQWLGPIPKSWEYIPGKFVFKYRSEKGNDTPVLLAATQKNGMFPQELLEGVVKVKEDTDLQQFQTVHKNDYVISLRSFQGGFEISDYEGVCSPAYQVFFNQKPINHRYYKYLFKSIGFIQEMDSVTVGIREGKNIPYNNFGMTFIPYPSLSEQSRIASFLDDRCAKIDASIQKCKDIINKLDEYRKAVITKAVTKGCFIPLKYITSYNLESLSETTPREFDFDYVDISSVSYERGIQNKERIYFENSPSRARRIVKPGDVIVSTVRTYLKAIAQVPQFDFPLVVSTGFIVLTAKNTVLPSFLGYALKSENFIYEVELNSYGISYPAIKASTVVNLKVQIPSLSEQNEIVTFLDKHCAEIDSSKAKNESIIKKLEEYKKSLIYNATTGKIEC